MLGRREEEGFGAGFCFRRHVRLDIRYSFLDLGVVICTLDVFSGKRRLKRKKKMIIEGNGAVQLEPDIPPWQFRSKTLYKISSYCRLELQTTPVGRTSSLPVLDFLLNSELMRELRMTPNLF